MRLEIRPIESFPAEMVIMAKRDGLVFCANTKYIGAYQEGKLVGVSGYLLYKHKAIFKNHFVPEHNRGARGFFRYVQSADSDSEREWNLSSRGKLHKNVS